MFRIGRSPKRTMSPVLISDKKQHRAPRLRAFTGLVGRGLSDDIEIKKTEIAASQSPTAPVRNTDLLAPINSPDRPKKPEPKKTKTARVEHDLSVREVADLLRNDLIAKYGTNITPIQLPPRTQVALDKHDGVRCGCNSHNRNCARVRQRLFNEAKNKLQPKFTPWFTIQEIQNYLAYARGENGLGELKPYFENIERRVIRCALILGLMKPLKDAPRIPQEVEEDINEQMTIATIVKTTGTEDDVIGGQIITEGENLKKRRVFGIQKPLKTFDKSIIKRNRRERSHDLTVDSWIEKELARLEGQEANGVIVSGSKLDHARKALDELFKPRTAA